VEIRKKRGLPPPLGKASPEGGATFPHSHRPYYPSLFEKALKREKAKLL
jgi:hypothetical protein